jgi:hypothetical protein
MNPMPRRSRDLDEDADPDQDVERGKDLQPSTLEDEVRSRTLDVVSVATAR